MRPPALCVVDFGGPNFATRHMIEFRQLRPEDHRPRLTSSILGQVVGPQFEVFTETLRVLLAYLLGSAGALKGFAGFRASGLTNQPGFKSFHLPLLIQN